MQVYEFPTNKPTLGARLQLPGFLLSFDGTGDKVVEGGNDEMLHIISLQSDADGASLKVGFSPQTQHPFYKG